MMTKEELINKAKVVVIPFIKGHRSAKKNDDYDKDKEAFLETHEHVIINNINKENLYNDLEYHWHHMHSEYYYDKMMPILNDLLNFGYKRDDFLLIKDKDGKYDFNFLIPKVKQYYKVDTISFKNEGNGNFNYMGITNYETSMSLSSVDECWSACIFDTWGKYHRLFKYTHVCCKITNDNAKSNRILLISGDSHLAPAVPILSYYFKKVIMMDKHDDTYMAYDYLTDGEEITDMLIGMWDNRPLNKYIVNNLL